MPCRVTACWGSCSLDLAADKRTGLQGAPESGGMRALIGRRVGFHGSPSLVLQRAVAAVMFLRDDRFV